MTVNVESIDRRTIAVTFPASPGELSAALAEVARDGYEVTGASVIEGGQRDPITTGMRIVVQRKGSG